MNQELLIKATDRPSEAIRKINENISTLMDNAGSGTAEAPHIQIDSSDFLQTVEIDTGTTIVNLEKPISYKNDVKLNYGGVWIPSSFFTISSDNTQLIFNEELLPKEDGTPQILEIYYNNFYDIHSLYNVTELYEEEIIPDTNQQITLSRDIKSKNDIFIIYDKILIPTNYYDISTENNHTIVFHDYELDPSVDIHVRYVRSIIAKNDPTNNTGTSSIQVSPNILYNSTFTNWKRSIDHNTINNFTADLWYIGDLDQTNTNTRVRYLNEKCNIIATNNVRFIQYISKNMIKNIKNHSLILSCKMTGNGIDNVDLCVYGILDDDTEEIIQAGKTVYNQDLYYLYFICPNKNYKHIMVGLKLRQCNINVDYIKLESSINMEPTQLLPKNEDLSQFLKIPKVIHGKYYSSDEDYHYFVFDNLKMKTSNYKFYGTLALCDGFTKIRTINITEENIYRKDNDTCIVRISDQISQCSSTYGPYLCVDSSYPETKLIISSEVL